MEKLLLWVGQAPRWIGQAPPRVGQAPLWVGQALLRVGQSPFWIEQTPSRDGEKSGPDDFPCIHILQAGHSLQQEYIQLDLSRLGWVTSFFPTSFGRVTTFLRLVLEG